MEDASRDQRTSKVRNMEDVVVVPNFVDDSDVLELISLLESDEDIQGEFLKVADDVSVVLFTF